MRRRNFLGALAGAALAPALAGMAPRQARADGHEVVVVGGGLAGLAAAWALKDRDVVLLEREPTVGGRAQAGQWNGMVYAKGPRYLEGDHPQVNQLLGQLALEPVGMAEPIWAMAAREKFFTGARILDFLPDASSRRGYAQARQALLGLAGKERVARRWRQHPTELMGLATPDTQNADVWLRSQRVHDLARLFLDTLNRDRLGASNREISALLDLALLEPVLPGPGPGPARRLMEGGWARVARSLGDGLAGAVRTGATALRARLISPGLEVQYKAGGDYGSLRARCVILACPAGQAAHIMAPAVPTDLVQTLRGINYSVVGSLNLFLDRRVELPAWTCLCTDTRSFLSIHDQAAAPDGGSIMELRLCAADGRDRTMLDTPRKTLVSRALSELERYLRGVSRRVVGYDLTLHPAAHPIPSPGFARTLAVLDQTGPFRGPVLLAGDYLGYPDAVGALTSGLRAAQRAREWLG